MPDDDRDARTREFSRRELLRAGWAVPAALSLCGLAAACGGGHDDVAAEIVALARGDKAPESSKGQATNTTAVAHTDTGHTDTSHTDTGHTDARHTDTPHVDGGRTSHVDRGGGEHSDRAHTDVPHLDTPHADAHGDEDAGASVHYDTHGDHDDASARHDDHSDGPNHLDYYYDRELYHDDSPHNDHTDGVPHTDTHADTPHVDTAHDDG